MFGLCFGLAVQAVMEIEAVTTDSAQQGIDVCVKAFKNVVWFDRNDPHIPKGGPSEYYYALLDSCQLRMS